MKKLYTAVIFLALFLFALFNTTHGALLSSLIDHYGLRMASQGSLSAAQNAGCAAALLISFFLVRHLGKPRALCLAICAAALLILPMGAAPAFSILTALCALLGISLGLIDTLASAGIAEMYTGRSASAMMCLLHAIFGIAGVLMPRIIHRVMASGLSWNVIYYGVGAAAAGISLYALPICRRAQKTSLLKTDSGDIQLTAVLRFLSHRDCALILICTALYTVSLSNVQLWIERYMDSYLGRSDLSAISLSLFWLGVTASRLLLSFARIRPLTYLRYGMPLSGLLLLAGVLSGSGAMVCALCALSALSSGAAIPMALCEQCDRYAGASLVPTTVTFMFIYLVQFLTPLSLGFITDTAGIHAALYPAIAALFLSGAAAFATRSKSA